MMKLGDRTKETILKILIVVGMCLLILIIPLGTLLGFLGVNQEISELIVYTNIFSFFGVGILLMILMPLFGGLKQQPVKAETIPLHHPTYSELFVFLQRNLLKKGYQLQKVVRIQNEDEILVYVRRIRSKRLESVTIIYTKELSEDFLEVVNESISEVLMERCECRNITEAVDMISIFCVDRINGSFRKLVNGNVNQGLKNGRLPVGISFGGGKIYIAKQKDGFAITKYKKLRKEFLDIMNNLNETF